MKPSGLIAITILCCIPVAPAVAQVAAIDTQNGNSVSFAMNYTITAPPGTNSVQFIALVPRTLAGRQNILKVNCSPKPARRFDRDGCSYVEFLFVKPARTTEISISVDAEIRRFDLSVASGSKTKRAPETKGELEKWLVHEQYLEKNAPEIREVAKSLLGKNEEETIRKTMAFVVGEMRKGPHDGEDRGALWALRKKQGDCTEFSDLFVTLCRANNLPARFRQGYLIDDVRKGDTAKHDWAEVYVGKYGWVPFDPLHVHLGSATVEKMRPIYVYLDSHRRNAVLDNHHFASWRWRGDHVQVQFRGSFTLKSRKPIASK